jgi:hypothetical protein
MAYSLSVSSNPPMAVAETPLFVRQAANVWDDIEREAFIDFIARNPRAGDIIPDTGGIRKVRWGRGGQGKRGGARVIYFYHDSTRPLYLLMVYAKARREDLNAQEKQVVRDAVAVIKRSRQG